MYSATAKCLMAKEQLAKRAGAELADVKAGCFKFCLTGNTARKHPRFFAVAQKHFAYPAATVVDYVERLAFVISE